LDGFLENRNIKKGEILIWFYTKNIQGCLKYR
jgi:hypothetical protein